MYDVKATATLFTSNGIDGERTEVPLPVEMRLCPNSVPQVFEVFVHGTVPDRGMVLSVPRAAIERVLKENPYEAI